MRPRGTGSLYKPKHSRFWHARVSGEWRTTGKETRQEAEIMLAGWIREASEHDGQLFTPTQKTVADLMTAYQADASLRGKACRVLGSIISTVAKTALGMRKARTIRTEHLSAFANERLAEGKSRDYVALMLRYVRAAFRYAQRIGELRSVPYVPILGDLRVRADFYSEQEVHAILPRLEPLYADACLWLYETGWRPIEVVRLRLDQVHLEWETPVVIIPKSKTGARALPLVGSLLEIMRRRVASSGQGGLFVFPSDQYRTKHIGASTLTRKWQAAAQAAGITGKTLYGLKRTAIRDMANAGLDIKTAMEITGHKTADTWRRYQIVDITGLQAGLHKLQDSRGRIALPPPDESQNCRSLVALMSLCKDLQPTVRLLDV